MTAENEQAAESGVFAWKRKRYFDGKTCGLKDCTRAPDGYISDKKPTKDHAAGRLWFGPACQKCIDKTHPGMRPSTLAELAHQRHGASDLAGILDIEVGDVLERLHAAGIDERGQPTPTTNPLAISFDPVVIPIYELSAKHADADAVLARLQEFHVVDQTTLDIAGEMTKMVKRSWNEIDEARKAIARPLQAKIKEIQAYFNPPLDILIKAETLLKTKISEGMQRAQAAQAAALQAAQAAHQQGDYNTRAMATQAAVQADVVRPQGVTIRQVLKWRIVSPMHIPIELWSPDVAKIQGAIDAGFAVPGIETWVEDQVGVRVG